MPKMQDRLAKENESEKKIALKQPNYDAGASIQNKNAIRIAD